MGKQKQQNGSEGTDGVDMGVTINDAEASKQQQTLASRIQKAGASARQTLTRAAKTACEPGRNRAISIASLATVAVIVIVAAAAGGAVASKSKSKAVAYASRRPFEHHADSALFFTTGVRACSGAAAVCCVCALLCGQLHCLDQQQHIQTARHPDILPPRSFHPHPETGFTDPNDPELKQLEKQDALVRISFGDKPIATCAK